MLAPLAYADSLHRYGLTFATSMHSYLAVEEAQVVAHEPGSSMVLTANNRAYGQGTLQVCSRFFIAASKLEKDA